MPCVTHHFACDCREAKVKEICEYLFSVGTSLTGPILAGGDFFNALDAAIDIASELYPVPKEGKDGPAK